MPQGQGSVPFIPKVPTGGKRRRTRVRKQRVKRKTYTRKNKRRVRPTKKRRVKRAQRKTKNRRRRQRGGISFEGNLETLIKNNQLDENAATEATRNVQNKLNEEIKKQQAKITEIMENTDENYMSKPSWAAAFGTSKHKSNVLIPISVHT